MPSSSKARGAAGRSSQVLEFPFRPGKWVRSSANTSNSSDVILVMPGSSIRFFVWHRRHFSISSPRPRRFSRSVPVSEHFID